LAQAAGGYSRLEETGQCMKLYFTCWRNQSAWTRHDIGRYFPSTLQPHVLQYLTKYIAHNLSWILQSAPVQAFGTLQLGVYGYSLAYGKGHYHFTGCSYHCWTV